MKKAIVTGSEGFIGKALVRELKREGVEVLEVDRMNYTGLVPDKIFRNEAKNLFYLMVGFQPDVVFHLAAQTSVFNNNKQEIISDNISTFKDVCEACKLWDVKLVYASSSCAAPGNATSLYGLSKRFDEEYAKIYNPEATGIRFHNVYGSEPRKGTLLWCLLNQREVKLYNRGMNRRHFTYIDDIIASMLYAADSDIPLLNACNPQLTSIWQFAEIVNQYYPVEYQLVDEKRELDKEEQGVENQIPVVPLRYTPVEIGIKRIFEG